MAHDHDVFDDDLELELNPTTRAIENPSGEQIIIMQGDHNSEEIVIKYPREIENHDMTLCDVVEVHYDNIGVGTSVSTRTVNSGVHQIKEFWAQNPDDGFMRVKWIITDNATQLYGSLEFSLKFICYDTENGPGYILNSDIFKGIVVKQSKNNNNAVYDRDPDLYRELDERLAKLEKNGGTGGSVAVDATLSIEGMAADAKAVGDALGYIDEALETILSGAE